MSHADHEWARELLPAHLAGGLNAEERARLEAHASTCAECIAEIDALRRFDRGMEEMFAPVRPAAGLEERVIRTLRHAPAQMPRTRSSRIALGIAAVVFIGLVGFAVMNYAEEGDAGFVMAGLGHEAPDPPPPAAEVTGGAWRGKFNKNIDESTNQVGGLENGDAIRVKMIRQSGVAEGEAQLNGRLKSAGEMARERSEVARVELVSPSRGGGGPLTGANFTLGESDHRESADRDDYGRMKGESKDFLSYAKEREAIAGKMRADAAMRTPAPASVPAAKPAPPRPAADGVFSLRDNSPADPGYFKPADMLAKADAPRPAPEPVLSDAEKAVLITTRKKPVVVTPDGKPQDPQPQARKIIRSGDMEFEIESFDSAVVKIDTIAAEEGGVIATVNSDKLQNGKVRGTVVIRVPPDHLGTLIIKLRALGDLKSQRLGSEDITKQYTDLESRLRAARTMEERLIRIIKEGKGEIKDLLLAEKELGEWRTKIEVAEGEKRYYDNLVSLSTLTITLSEKEIRAAYGLTETERVESHVEAEDVETAYKDLLAAVAEAKGRVTKSDLKKLTAGQFSATVNFEVAPDGAVALRARLKLLGNVTHLDVTTVQQAEGGRTPGAEVKVKRNDSQFYVSIYNLANVSPRETVLMSLACVDTEAVYKSILDRIEKAAGVVKSSNLNRQKSDQTTGVVTFQVKSADADAVLADLRALGEVISLQMTENQDVANVTRSKRGYVVNLHALGTTNARETMTIHLAAKDVAAAYRVISEAVRKAEGRVFSANLNENDRRNVTASLNFDVRRAGEKGVAETLAAAGEVYTRTSNRLEDTQNVVDSKVRMDLTIFPVENVPPRELVRLGIEVGKVDAAVEAIQKIATDVKGRIHDSQRQRDPDGRHVTRLVVDVPYREGRAAASRMKELGMTRVEESRPNTSVPDSEIALTRFDITVSNEVLVATDSAPWASIKKGFSVSVLALSWSLTLVMVGLCFVLPLALIGWGSWRLAKRARKAPATPAA